MQSKHIHSNIVIMIEGALCIALAFVLSKLNLFRMPQGGSVNFELVPLMIFAYRRGLRKGLLAGFLNGILKMIVGGYILNPAQAALDYPVAFMCVGLAALSPKIWGFFLAACSQILCSVLSGVIFFAEYALEGQNPWIYSFLYNAPVLGAKYLISFIAALFLWKALEKNLPSK